MLLQHPCGDIEIQRLDGARTEELPELGEGRLLRLVGNKEQHLVSHGWPPLPFGGRASDPIPKAFPSRRTKGTVFHQSEAPIQNWRLGTPAPAFPAARDWRSLPGRAARSRLPGLKK